MTAALSNSLRLTSGLQKMEGSQNRCPMFYPQYTQHNDVNQILDRVLTDAKDVLRSQFIGMYLFGSLANGDFDLASDIDILIVTAEALSDETFSRLQTMHREIAKMDSHWAVQLEVSYM